jgi:hypothetical protein
MEEKGEKRGTLKQQQTCGIIAEDTEEETGMLAEDTEEEAYNLVPPSSVLNQNTTSLHTKFPQVIT